MAHRMQVEGEVRVLLNGEDVFDELLITHKALVKEFIQEGLDRKNCEFHAPNFRYCMHPKCVALREGRNETNSIL